MWAAFDVGATSPDEIGHLFAWGEIEPKEKSQFTWSTYKFGGYSQLTKYCTEGAYGILDNKVTLDLEDDAANVHWGGDWRMPTVEEVTELRKKMREAGVEYKVYKNTLVRKAAKEVGIEQFNDELLVGTNAIAFGYEDPVAPARILKEFMDGEEHDVYLLIKKLFFKNKRFCSFGAILQMLTF